MGSTRWLRFVGYAAIAFYGIYWAYTVFTKHTIGNYGVETDFYWKYGPAAKDLLRGVISIENYDSKGWGFPLVVAAVSLLGLDVFRAGQIITLLSAVGTALIVFRLHRSLFGPVHALASVALLFTNLTFVQNTYEVGTDLFSIAVSLVSIALLLRSKSPGWRSIVASGVIGGYAFATRYNALFLLPGALLLFLVFRVPDGGAAKRLRRAGVWTASFLAGALPWLVVNAMKTGNPLTNSNYVNVGYTVYGEGNWEKFFYGERNVHSLPDVILLDPMRFIGTMIRNFGDHLFRDGTELMPAMLGILVLLGAVLLWRDKAERRVVAYFVFGALWFLTMVPVFYGARFSLAVLSFYMALAAWPLVSPTLGKPLQGLERTFPVRAFAFLLLLIPAGVGTYNRVEDTTWKESVTAGPYDLLEAVDFLRTAPRNEGEGLMARKPHAAFMAGMRFVPMPEFDTPESLHATAERERARFILISAAEVRYRSGGIAPFAEAKAPIPGFRLVFGNRNSLLYMVVPYGEVSTAP
ncbi:MAG TPA: glycosyltransferase family 39 protein [Candidatus Eisenbacteria bacterium]|nr:glycosyltransferase family 39 protein [Candidatus Eisenbacteria bacterium]